MLLDISFRAFQVSALLPRCDGLVRHCGVLIIGSKQFQPRYIKNQERGGGAAVRELQHKVEEYMTSIGFDAKSMIIQVRAYACPMIPPESFIPQMGAALDAELQQFFGHFNKTHALAEIINVGKGVAGVDEKLCSKFMTWNDFMSLS